MFNVCPENSLKDGYITEKILEACMSGCIPIYWGDKNFELDVVNDERVIFINDEREVAEKVKRLLEPKYKQELFNLVQKPVFKGKAIEKIDHYVSKFDAIVSDFLDKEKSLGGYGKHSNS